MPKGWEFLLTTDREVVQDSIAEARRKAKRGESVWPKYHLLWELHPVMQWLIDKVLCRLERHEAPVVVAPQLGAGRWAYLFHGILSNRRSQPVVVDWFAVSYDPSGASEIVSLDDVLARTGLRDGLSNLGESTKLQADLDEHREAAVKLAREHMLELRARRREDLRERIEADRERFELWYLRSTAQIQAYEKRRRSDGGKVRRDVAEKVRRWTETVEGRKKRREEWFQDSLQVVERPYLKLAAAFTGE